MASEEDNNTTTQSQAEQPMTSLSGAVSPAGKPVDTSRKSPPKYPEPRQRPAGGSPGAAAVTVPAGDSFFSIHKKGQGYWTRMGTAAGAAIIGLMTAGFLFEQLPAQFPSWGGQRYIQWSVVGGFILVYLVVAFWLTNRARHVDFLIATDSEMKKVNWTSKADLIGSTKVVVLFMFLMATVLFVIDVLFGYIFYFVDVLKAPPI